MLLGESPVHGQKHRTRADALGDGDASCERAAARGDRCNAIGLEGKALGVIGMHLKARFGMHRLNALNLGGPRHGVPMAQIAAHREHQGISLTGWFG